MITKELTCDLTDDEREEYREKLADHAQSFADLEARKADLAASAKKERAEIDRIAKALREGKETRDVECYEVQVFPHTVELRRRDTKALVESRPMRDDERQLPLATEGSSQKRIKPKKPKDAAESDGDAEGDGADAG